MQQTSDMFKNNKGAFFPIYGKISYENYTYCACAYRNKNLILKKFWKPKYETVEIPLAIQTIKVKKSKNCYKIQIILKNQEKIQIKAPVNSKKYGNQEENLSNFASYLQEEYNRQANFADAADIPGMDNVMTGTLIRKQYFNIPIYNMALIFAQLAVFSILRYCRVGHPLWGLKADITAVIVWLLLSAICALLSLYNRHYFGKVICSFSEKECILPRDRIPCANITELHYIQRGVYKPRKKVSQCNLFITYRNQNGNAITREIIGCPYMILKEFKKRNPNISVTVDSHFLILDLTILGILTVIVSFIL